MNILEFCIDWETCAKDNKNHNRRADESNVHFKISLLSISFWSLHTIRNDALYKQHI